MCSVFFELNGQPRNIEITDHSFIKSIAKKLKADSNNDNHVGSPLPGQISQIFVNKGKKIIKGDKILIIEAMKMETTIIAEKSGVISDIHVNSGDNVNAKDLLLEIS